MYTAPELPRATFGEANIRLGKLEAQHNVTILFAVESGSRAWGFPSPDSDNDVRFFYVRPLSQYVGIEERRDVIETPIDGLWDVNGWDLRKALRLLVGGNATVTEWLSSPLIYREHGPFPYRLRDLIKRHAVAESSANHYYGLTNTCFKKDIEARSKTSFGAPVTTSDINQKKYLYAIRGALSISWVARYNEIPPMTMPALMSHDIMPVDVRTEINELLIRKSNMGEFMNGPRIPCFDDFVQGQLAWVKANGLDKITPSVEFKHEANQLLLDALGIG